jgi:hypothetical protein
MDRKKKQKTYVPRTNAISVTVYHPQGEIIPADVASQCVDAVRDVVDQNRLFIDVVTS